MQHTKAVLEAVTISKLVLTPLGVCGDGGVAFEVGVRELAIEPAPRMQQTKR